MRVIVRKERPYPDAQLRLTNIDGHRITAFATNSPNQIYCAIVALACEITTWTQLPALTTYQARRWEPTQTTSGDLSHLRSTITTNTGRSRPDQDPNRRA